MAAVPAEPHAWCQMTGQSADNAEANRTTVGTPGREIPAIVHSPVTGNRKDTA